ncbi:MAG: GNAT family N-acetyltransferase [Bacteroidetes bacterium]|nr:GNAT family N-acetyltransferase [Bacteroidota bacterium]
MDDVHYTVRQFKPEELETYKAIRLEALKMEHGKYGNSYEYELAMPETEWIDRISNPLHARYGLYAADTLIGLTGIIINKDNPTEAYMTQSYIRKEHRGKGLSAMLYNARINWAKEHGVKRLVISHRKSNVASKAANQKFGFKYTHSEDRTWPDGVTEENLFYELML